jgi:riboflavin kinase/FMN adenylyltransferase
MLLLRTLDDVPRGASTVCCIGSFDGVHLGHQRLIGDAVTEARARGMRSAVVTFFPHPRAVIGGAIERYLTLPDEKAALIASLGVDELLIHEFTPETARTRAEDFTRALVDAFRLKSLWAGPDFAFGYRREGNAAWLGGAAERFGFTMHVAEPLLLDGRPVSSTRVREALQRGAMQEVHRLLGRPYSLSGHVSADGVHVQLDDRRIWPCAGEYAVQVQGEAAVLRVGPPGDPAFFDRAVPTISSVQSVNFA